MNALVKKIHMYAGLLSFSILLVFGLIGSYAMFLPHPEQRPRPQPNEIFVAYSVPPNLTDQQVADHVRETLQLSMAPPVPPPAVRRNRDNNLAFQFFQPTGWTRVTVLEKENKLRVETFRNRIMQYLNVLHETTVRNRATDLRVKLWTYYNEFSIWTLLLMGSSGVWLWLSSRPGHRWAQVFFAAGTASFAALYFLSR